MPEICKGLLHNNENKFLEATFIFLFYVLFYIITRAAFLYSCLGNYISSKLKDKTLNTIK